MRQEVKEWWRQAEEDLDSAEYNFKGGKYYLAVFLCQQATEKALKAYFIKKKNTQPASTHSLIYLATETEVPKKFFRFLKRLTPQFVNTRYPDAAYGIPSELYDEGISSEFLTNTKEFLKWLSSKMKK